jgi:MFS family permease
LLAVEGSYIKSESEIYRTIILIAVFSLLGIPFITLLPVFAGEIFRTGAKGFGFLVGATGAGALSAALFLAFRGDIKGKDRLMSFAALFFSTALFVFSISKNLYLSMLLLIAIGGSLVSFLALANSFTTAFRPRQTEGKGDERVYFCIFGDGTGRQFTYRCFSRFPGYNTCNKYCILTLYNRVSSLFTENIKRLVV